MAEITAATMPAAAPGEKKNLTPEKERQLRKVCADFEALFTYELLKQMRRTVPQGGLFPQTTKTDTYHMFLDQHIAEELSKHNGGLGIQKLLYRQLLKTVAAQGGKR
ncbi:MAG TPA: rod-binding protein [Syntrophales bacterium]|nr:rod-binding protein [Syntrophales bacterium]HOM06880.1 rod-binding protein [Syntrophales bacterium]HON99397.1 rod-binding protein [Syntrophales bacterium]HPC00566.1 rod-binding protein [Syntrophales bacterium]HPQ06421.1 rod-binding protein [Syntrophales bacterium]